MPTFNYTLVSGRDQAPLEFYAVQGEAKARTFALSLRYQNGQTGVGASSTAYAYVVKNDGHVAVMDCQVAAGVVTFTLSPQACTCPGYNKVFVQVLSEQTESRWDNMVLFVKPCDIENAVASTDDLGPLANLITDPDYLNSVIDAYETATEQVEALLGQITPKGEYDPNTTYSKLNIVSYEGASYVANGPTRGNPPTDTQHWTMLSQRGEQGKQGVQGPQGPRGEQGPAGPQGPPGETGPQGPQGEKGDTGTGLDILGTYDNLEALQSAVTQPQQGNMYNVGTTAPYTVYMWDTTNGGEWISQGQLQGAKGETGPQGPQGEPGPQGPQGPQGEQGPQGQQGGPGQAATIQVGQVTTGKPGSQATVTNSGTENAAVLNFVIPQGATGQTGPTGPAPNLEIGTVNTLPAGQNATANITGTTPNFALNLGLPRGESGASTWNDITGKPSTFPPAAHNQAISTITGLENQLNRIKTFLPAQQMADYIIDAGTGGVWKYEQYYSGKLHIWGNIPVNNVKVTVGLGSLYRSENAYTGSSYGFPLRFLDTPTINMAFITSNANSAFVWQNPDGVTNLRRDPCSCYLVRPTSGTVSGWVCYDAWGYYN